MNRPQGDALFNSLAKVAETYGGTTDVARLQGVLANLELGDIPPELAQAVAETLTYVYALDQAMENRPLPAASQLTTATRQLGEALLSKGTSLGLLGKKDASTSSPKKGER